MFLTIKTILNINNVYLLNLIYTIILYFVLKIILKVFYFFNRKFSKNDKQFYVFNQRNKTIFYIAFIFITLIIWKNQLSSFLTFISVISAAFTLAIREIIFNYFCGIYIKAIKPIKVEDRVKVGDVIGDIININFLNFEVLEVNEETNQSTGKVVHIPNSTIISSPVKNYNTAFKYIWDDLNIYISVDSDIDTAKEIILDIVKNNEVIKEIPYKMKKEIAKSTSKYRIYYNNLTPIIYTKIEENKIILTVRFLIHPKKQRNIESDIYEKIIQEFKKNNITIV